MIIKCEQIEVEISIGLDKQVELVFLAGVEPKRIYLSATEAEILGRALVLAGQDSKVNHNG